MILLYAQNICAGANRSKLEENRNPEREREREIKEGLCVVFSGAGNFFSPHQNRTGITPHAMSSNSPSSSSIYLDHAAAALPHPLQLQECFNTILHSPAFGNPHSHSAPSSLRTEQRIARVRATILRYTYISLSLFHTNFVRSHPSCPSSSSSSPPPFLGSSTPQPLSTTLCSRAGPPQQSTWLAAHSTSLQFHLHHHRQCQRHHHHHHTRTLHNPLTTALLPAALCTRIICTVTRLLLRCASKRAQLVRVLRALIKCRFHHQYHHHHHQQKKQQ